MTIQNDNASSSQGKLYQMSFDRTVLTSWKEIAQYMGKGVRTVQRWEKMNRLPVRRTNSSAKSSVLVLLNELEAWISDQRLANSQREPELESRQRLAQQVAELQAQVLELQSERQRNGAELA